MSAGWQPLRDSGLHARALRIERADVAFFKHLLESYEEVGIVRTVETHADGTVSIAILVPSDFVRIGAEILEDLARYGAPPFTAEGLPPVCTEDWFLATWTREREDGGGEENPPAQVPASAASASPSLPSELTRKT